MTNYNIPCYFSEKWEQEALTPFPLMLACFMCWQQRANDIKIMTEKLYMQEEFDLSWLKKGTILLKSWHIILSIFHCTVHGASATRDLQKPRSNHQQFSAAPHKIRLVPTSFSSPLPDRCSVLSPALKKILVSSLHLGLLAALISVIPGLPLPITFVTEA